MRLWLGDLAGSSCNLLIASFRTSLGIPAVYGQKAVWPENVLTRLGQCFQSVLMDR